MNVSIAMATFNGERYIEDQLASFVTQTVLPHELIVCDDMSEDNTVDIVSRFARRAPFKVEIVQNESTLGFIRNFEKAISLCTGELVFLSDQDDVWFPKKIEYVAEEFSSDLNVLFVLNDQEIVDQDLKSLSQTRYSLSRSNGLDETTIAVGCCTAIKRDFCDLVIPFPSPMIGWHDEWMHRVASALGVRKASPRVLQYYRRHGRNASPLSIGRSGLSILPRFLWRSYWKDPIENWLLHIQKQEQLCEMFRNRTASLEALGLSQKVTKFLEDYKHESQAYEQRIAIVKRNKRERFGAVIRLYMVGFYDNFNGWKSAIKDILR
jgi:glycosyltransferase involved in cell wall biosynthesis